MHAGFQLLIGVSCFGVTLYQCIVLIENYIAKSSIWKNSDRTLTGDLPTPMIIICSDPPNNDTENDLVMNINDYDGALKIKKMNSIFKVFSF